MGIFPRAEVRQVKEFLNTQEGKSDPIRTLMTLEIVETYIYASVVFLLTLRTPFAGRRDKRSTNIASFLL